MKNVILVILGIFTSFQVYTQNQGTITTLVESNWDNPSQGVDGWSFYNAQLAHEETGGNPEGYVVLSAINLSTIFNNSSDYTGNFVQKGYNHISFDIMFPQALPAGYDSFTGQLRINPTDGAEWLFQLRDFTPSQTGVWQHNEIIFNPEWDDQEAMANGWRSRVNSGAANYKSFRYVMENVNRLAFYRISGINQMHVIGFDNFNISDFVPTPEVEEPELPFTFVQSTWDDATKQLDSWEAEGATLHFFEHRGTGGNPGGFVMVRGHGGISILNEESAFTGNYIEKQCNTISLDILVPQALPVLDNQSHIASIRVISESAGEWVYPLKQFNASNTGTWQHLEVVFNPEWTNAQAETNGWYSGYTNGATFSNVMSNVVSLGFSRYYQSGIYDLGIDNFKLSKVIAQSTPTIQKSLKQVNIPTRKVLTRPIQKTKPPTKRTKK
ncbi:MAG: hypothetical protein R3182_11060 [Draconibacterium sp.]|nr:hypothetical protein [Draconibacterium sp.]